MRIINGEVMDKALAEFSDNDMISVRTVKTLLENTPTLTVKDITETMPKPNYLYYLLRALKAELDTIDFDKRKEAENDK